MLAWYSPVCGVLCVGFVYAIARRFASPDAALGAAFVYACFDIANEYGVVGSGDHHAYVATIGAAWLWLAIAFVSPATRRLGLVAAGLVAVRLAMTLGWNGSLLYVAIADGCVAFACVALGDRKRLAWFGVGALVSAAGIAPVVAASATPLEGPFSSIALSWLHVALCVALAAGAFAIAGIEALSPSQSVRTRLLRATALVVAACALALLLPASRESVMAAYRWIAMTDLAGAVTYEQMPLFAIFGREPNAPPWQRLGAFAYLVPIAPLLPLLLVADPQRRNGALSLAAWSAPLAVLTITQARYGNELAVPFAVGLAIGIDALARLLRPRFGETATASMPAVGVALAMLPSLLQTFGRVPRSLAHLRGAAPQGDPLLATPTGTLVRFALMVRDATPETSGYLDDTAQPEWGLLSNPIFGHVLRYYAQRPLTIDNFWDRFESFERATGFGDIGNEPEAVATLRDLRVRYLVTAAAGQRDIETVNGRLQTEDGVANEGRPRLEQFRLITEGPRGGRPVSDLFGVKRPAVITPYKLFEVVPGAQLEVPAAPGAQVTAEVVVRTPEARRFVYRAAATANEQGIARLRVPYATRTNAPAHPVGPWRVRVGDAEWSVDVDDAQVQSGATVRLDDAASRATQ